MRSAGSFRARNHLLCTESPMETVWPLSSLGASSTGTSGPKSRSSMSPQSAPAMTGSPLGPPMASSAPQMLSVSSGAASSMASSKDGSGGNGTFSNVVFSKMAFTDRSSGQFPESPAVGRQRGTGGESSRALREMCAAMSLSCSCSSNFGMNSVKLWAFAVRAASGICPISAMILTRSSMLPRSMALLKRDMTSFRISAILSIFFSFMTLPVMRYRKDKASKFFVFW
mmetsp:Transcript_53769/g.154364  ORF Transcript_53769/g.154364 Transcript_53769/m.154364 type:complete len:227 (-) Transcript_53769:2275-2955(-)